MTRNDRIRRIKRRSGCRGWDAASSGGNRLWLPESSAVGYTSSRGDLEKDGECL